MTPESRFLASAQLSLPRHSAALLVQSTPEGEFGRPNLRNFPHTSEQLRLRPHAEVENPGGTHTKDEDTTQQLPPRVAGSLTSEPTEWAFAHLIAGSGALTARSS